MKTIIEMIASLCHMCIYGPQLAAETVSHSTDPITILAVATFAIVAARDVTECSKQLIGGVKAAINRIKGWFDNKAE